MTYTIIETVNGAFFIRAEGIQTIEAAKTQFHGRCQTLWNAQDVKKASIMIVNEQLECVEGYKEFITHA